MNLRKTSFGDNAEAWGTRARKLPDNELDITPMIDVTFLLLIFFMVTSTMQPKLGLDVPVAKNGLGIEKSGATIVYLRAPTVTGSTDAVVLLADGDGNLVESTLEEVRQEVQNAVQANRSDVIIKADARAPHGAVSEVAELLNSIDGVTFFIGVRDKREQ